MLEINNYQRVYQLIKNALHENNKFSQIEKDKVLCRLTSHVSIGTKAFLHHHSISSIAFALYHTWSPA